MTRDRSNEREQRRGRGLAPDDPRHGKYTTYDNWICRCDRCTKAKAAKNAQDKERRNQQRRERMRQLRQEQEEA